jgi:hypothetical protein
MKPRILYPVLLLLMLLTSCNNFLNEPQDNRTVLDSEDKVAELLVNAYADAQYAEFAEAMSDNADDKGPAAALTETNTGAYAWDDYESITDRDSPGNFWTNSYQAIAHANQALATLETLPPGARTSALKGEALLARAYAHFMLVNLFSVRYNPATAAREPGIPYVLRPEENAVVEYTRETVEQTYRLIANDLEAGLALVGNEYQEPKFHFTQKAAHAFAARFYLYTGEWDKVIGHANSVLGNGSPALVIRDMVSPSVRAMTYAQTTAQYSSVVERANLMMSWTSSLVGRNFAAVRYGFSAAKQQEIFGDATTNPFKKAWAYRIFGIEIVYNIPKYQEYFRITNVTAGTGEPYASLVHFTTDEALLARAEAYAMLGQFDAASADLTAYLSQKLLNFSAANDKVTLALLKTTYPFIPNEYTPFYSLTEDQTAFIKAIAEFRRREFYHEGMRWFDIKRFNLVVTHARVSNVPMVLPKDDLRRAIQIPETAKAFGIEANKR